MYIKSAGDEAKIIHWFDNAGVKGLNQLCSLLRGWSDSVEVLVKWQRQYAMHRIQLADGRVVDAFDLWASTREFTLSPHFNTGIAGPVGDIVAGRGAEMNTPDSLEAFLTTYNLMAQTYQRKCLFFWAHADGPGGVFWSVTRKYAPKLFPERARKKADVLHKDYSGEPLRQEARNWIELQELEAALAKQAPAKLQQFDFFCFNACQDATLELAAVLSPYGEVLIASQSSTPIVSGWAFDEWPKALDATLFSTNEIAAEKIVDVYAALKHDHGVLSAIRLSDVSNILNALRQFADLLLSDWLTLRNYFDEGAQNCPPIPYSYSDKRDIVKLFDSVKATLETHMPERYALIAACDEIIRLTIEATIAHSTCKKTQIYGYNGLSIYLPDGSQSMSIYALSAYAKTSPDFGKFKAQTRWNEVVEKYSDYLRGSQKVACDPAMKLL